MITLPLTPGVALSQIEVSSNQFEVGVSSAVKHLWQKLLSDLKWFSCSFTWPRFQNESINIKQL